MFIDQIVPASFLGYALGFFCSGEQSNTGLDDSVFFVHVASYNVFGASLLNSTNKKASNWESFLVYGVE